MLVTIFNKWVKKKNQIVSAIMKSVLIMRTTSSSSFGNNVKYLSTISFSVLSADDIFAAVYDSSKLMS